MQVIRIEFCGVVIPLQVVATRARLKVPTDDGVCPLALRELISTCTEERPADRPCVDHIISELRRMIKYCRRD